ncbi:MAG: AAA family ATPase [Duodenibacillus sp.]|nr:AAA family ATPase [Duodenibacillus sp.]
MRMHFTDRISARTFGLRSDKTVLGFASNRSLHSSMAHVPAVDPDHTFDPSVFEAVRTWWEWPDTRAPLYLSGPAGCGKTSTVEQFLARVNAPSIRLTCRARMDKTELVGHWGASCTGFAWFDGPVTAAWRYGYVLVLNEFTVAPAHVWVSLNDVLEGAPITIEATGEVVERHPNARVVITDNCALGAGSTGRYRSRQAQDASTLDRCWHVAVDWLTPADETQLLERRMSVSGIDASLRHDLALAAVRFAAATRAQAGGNAPVCPVSTRVLVRFVNLLAAFVSARQALPASARRLMPSPLERALDLSLTAGVEADVRASLMQHAHFAFAACKACV